MMGALDVVDDHIALLAVHTQCQRRFAVGYVIARALGCDIAARLEGVHTAPQEVFASSPGTDAAIGGVRFPARTRTFSQRFGFDSMTASRAFIEVQADSSPENRQLGQRPTTCLISHRPQRARCVHEPRARTRGHLPYSRATVAAGAWRDWHRSTPGRCGCRGGSDTDRNPAPPQLGHKRLRHHGASVDV
jgi:hypothetical protein